MTRSPKCPKSKPIVLLNPTTNLVYIKILTVFFSKEQINYRSFNSSFDWNYPVFTSCIKSQTKKNTSPVSDGTKVSKPSWLGGPTSLNYILSIKQELSHQYLHCHQSWISTLKCIREIINPRDGKEADSTCKPISWALQLWAYYIWEGQILLNPTTHQRLSCCIIRGRND